MPSLKSYSNQIIKLPSLLIYSHCFDFSIQLPYEHTRKKLTNSGSIIKVKVILK